MTILEDKGNRRTVQLSQEFGYDQNITWTVAHIGPTHVNLVRIEEIVGIQDDGNPMPQEKIALTMAEVKALFAAVVKYENDMAASRIAEELRQKEVEREARELATKLGLTIQETPNDYDESRSYLLKHAHRYISRARAYSVDNLLEYVKAFQSELDTERNVIKDANELAGFIAASTGDAPSITPTAPSENGLYDLKITGRFAHCSFNHAYASQVFNRLDEIKRDIDREHEREVQHHEAAAGDPYIDML